MVGEKLESYLPQIARIAFKFSSMVGEYFESYLPQIARIGFKFSTNQNGVHGVLFITFYDFVGHKTYGRTYTYKIIIYTFASFSINHMLIGKEKWRPEMTRNALNCPPWLEKI